MSRTCAAIATAHWMARWRSASTPFRLRREELHLRPLPLDAFRDHRWQRLAIPPAERWQLCRKFDCTRTCSPRVASTPFMRLRTRTRSGGGDEFAVHLPTMLGLFSGDPNQAQSAGLLLHVPHSQPSGMTPLSARRAHFEESRSPTTPENHGPTALRINAAETRLLHRLP
jgi:hypothetical protein